MWSRRCIRSSSSSRVSVIFTSFFLCCFPGYISPAVVTLQSIEIYKTYELLNTQPTVYFSCGENKTVLPDVKEINVLYNFRGEESWQPLTELSSRKCKRCGFYEQDLFYFHDTFDEWELCPSDFTAPDGKYNRVKDGEFNATFLCQECISHTEESTLSDHHEGTGTRKLIIILLIVVIAIIVVVMLVAAYKYWQKWNRQQEQARFLKLFDVGDDIEDELGLEEVI